MRCGGTVRPPYSIVHTCIKLDADLDAHSRLPALQMHRLLATCS